MYSITTGNHPPLLGAYNRQIKSRVIREREVVQAKLDYYASILEICFAHHSKLLDRIKRLRQEISAATKGVPDTLGKEDLYTTEGNVQLDQAETLLCKKAYRIAARYAHPDKGGSHADFVAISESYRQRDLSALNEYVISRNNTIESQIQYWQDELAKPKIKLRNFHNSDQFKIVKNYVSNNEAKAFSLAEAYLCNIEADLFFELQSILTENT